MEVPCFTKSGASVVIFSNVDVVVLGGQEYLLTTMQDITERKQAEIEIEVLNTQLAARASELEAANTELEAFSSSVSHDLRRPLGNISGFCQVLQNFCADQLNDQCSGYLRNILEATQSMNSLIETLLNFSRHPSRKTAP